MVEGKNTYIPCKAEITKDWIESLAYVFGIGAK